LCLRLRNRAIEPWMTSMGGNIVTLLASMTNYARTALRDELL
jgi:hypothetical protein